MRLGIDLVDVDRFRRLIARMPSFADRFFSGTELQYCGAAPDPVLRLASTFAAKEAVMKALRLTPAAAWARRIMVSRQPDGAPRATVGDHDLAVSISHDGRYVIAVAIDAGPPGPDWGHDRGIYRAAGPQSGA